MKDYNNVVISMNKNKIAFLSYAHEDKDFAKGIARELRKEGIDVWIDNWEIKAGGSLIQKIFLEGLSKCDIFLILLSCASVKSKWVKEELDFAIIKKMEGVTRIISLIKEQCYIPSPLRALPWVDFSEGFDAGIRRTIKSIYDVSEKPPLGKIPELKDSVDGLSKVASTVGSILLDRQDDQLGFEKSYTGEEIKRLVPMLSPEEIDDAVGELKEYGLVLTRKYLGTAPYNFGIVEPTYALFLHFKDDGLDYAPFEDINTVASTVASKGQIDGNGLQELSGLRPVRINRAVAYLDDYGIIEVHSFLGTAPFSFGDIEATRRTRQFIEENCK